MSHVAPEDLVRVLCFPVLAEVTRVAGRVPIGR